MCVFCSKFHLDGTQSNYGTASGSYSQSYFYEAPNLAG